MAWHEAAREARAYTYQVRVYMYIHTIRVPGSSRCALQISVVFTAVRRGLGFWVYEGEERERGVDFQLQAGVSVQWILGSRIVRWR